MDMHICREVSWQKCDFNKQAQGDRLKARELETFLDACKILPADGRGEMPLRIWFEENTRT
jgi:hypothetical protein